MVIQPYAARKSQHEVKATACVRLNLNLRSLSLSLPVSSLPSSSQLALLPCECPSPEPLTAKTHDGGPTVVSQATDACANSKRSGTAREMSAPRMKYYSDFNMVPCKGLLLKRAV